METARSEKQEVIQDIIGFDFTRLWSTFRDLTIRPGQIISAYCDGDRSKYISPITYLFLTYGLVFLLMNVFNLPDIFFEKGRSLYEVPGSSPNSQAVNDSQENVNRVIDRIIEFMKSKEASLIISFPVFMLFQWLFYRRYRNSFFHNFYFVLFTFGHITLLTALLMIPMAHPSGYAWGMALSVLATFAYWVKAELHFYKLTLRQAIIRKLLQALAMIVPFIVWMSVVLVVVGLFFALEQR